MTPITPRPISTDLHIKFRGSKSSNVFTCFFFKVWVNPRTWVTLFGILQKRRSRPPRTWVTLVSYSHSQVHFLSSYDPLSLYVDIISLVPHMRHFCSLVFKDSKVTFLLWSLLKDTTFVDHSVFPLISYAIH